MSRGLFIGRFQPFHKGHYLALKDILDREDEVVIAIGSTQDSYTLENPLTAGERLEMIYYLLKIEGLLDRAYIVQVPDAHEYAVWPGRVIAYSPKFDRVYSGNEVVLMLFEKFGYTTVRIPHYKRDLYKGEEIRRRIIAGEPWEHLVPEPILEKLKEFNFVERILRLARRSGDE